MTALTVKRVSSHTENLEAIEALYCRAFPPNERRPFRDMLYDQTGCIEILAFYEDKQFCGFACLLNTDALSHIIYFAMDEDLRSRGYGSRALAAIHRQKAGRRIIVDIERPNERAENNLQRQRRRRFYLQNGYGETPVHYRWKRENYEILVYGGPLSKWEFARFWKQLDRSARI